MRLTLEVNRLATIRPTKTPMLNDTHVGSRFSMFSFLGCIFAKSTLGGCERRLGRETESPHLVCYVLSSLVIRISLPTVCTLVPPSSAHQNRRVMRVSWES